MLVVDGHPATRLLLTLQLQRLGHAVTHAEEGGRALRMCLETPFDVVLSDCEMPGMDGWRFARALRLHEFRRQCFPVVILGLTARRRTVDAQRCLAAGMDRCLPKPLSMARLSSLLSCEGMRAFGMGALEMSELERLAAGDATSLSGLLQVLIDTNRNDLKLLCKCARHRDLHGLRLLAHRIRGSVRMIKAQALIGACQEIEDQCNTTQASISDVMDNLRLASLQMRRLEICLYRHQASYGQSNVQARHSPAPSAHGRAGRVIRPSYPAEQQQHQQHHEHHADDAGRAIAPAARVREDR